MFYLFLMILAALGAGIYLVFFMQNVPGASEERFGVLEPLPPDLGVWKEDGESQEARAARDDGLKREVRTFFDESKGRLYKQVRYRSLSNNQIVRADADQPIKRRRIRS